MGTALFSGNSNYRLDVDASVQSQSASGNYSIIYWRVIVYKTWGTGFFGSGSGSANSNAGALWSTSFSYDFRGKDSIVFASGTFRVNHDANGFANYEVISTVNLSSLGSASAGSGVKSAARIPKVPGAPIPVGLDQIQATSMRYRFNGTTDGGSPIREWQIGYGTSPTNVQLYMTSSGTSIVPKLIPGTIYYFWSRGRNDVGWGPWSTRSSARTLAGAKIEVDGVMRDAVPYVKHEGVWKIATPYVNDKGIWKIPG